MSWSWGDLGAGLHGIQSVLLLLAALPGVQPIAFADALPFAGLGRPSAFVVHRVRGYEAAEVIGADVGREVAGQNALTMAPKM